MVAPKFLSLLFSVGFLSLQVASSPAPVRNYDHIAGKRDVDTHRSRSNAAAAKRQPHRRGNPTPSSHSPAIAKAMEDAMILAPILEDDLLPPHLEKRADDLSRLDLLQEVTMMYGGHAVNEQMYLANMTLHAPDPKHPLIMMEKFATLTSSSACTVPDKELTIKFKSKEAMDVVSESWNHINGNVDDFFYLIANDRSCCPDGQRHPYRVDAVKYEPAALTAILTIEGMEWEDVAGNFELNLGRYNVPKHTKRHAHTTELTKRFFNPGELAIKLITKLGIAPRIDYLESLYIDMSMGSSERKEILSDPFHEEKYLEVNCVDCYVRGGMEIGLRCKAEKGKIKDLFVFAQPKNLTAKLAVEFKTEAPTGEPLDYSQSMLPDLAIPGLSIPKIFTFGPSIQFNAGVNVYFLGIVNATAGVEVKIPDSAFIVADIVGPKSGATGFDAVKTDTSFRVDEATAKLEAGAYVGPALAFGIKALEKFGYEAVVQVKMPYVAARGWVGYESAGICPDSEEDSTTTTGVRVHLVCDFEIWLEVGSADSNIPTPFWLPEVSRILWDYEGPAKEFCKPFPIPGLSDRPAKGLAAGPAPGKAHVVPTSLKPAAPAPVAPGSSVVPRKSSSSGKLRPNNDMILTMIKRPPPAEATPLIID
ncbi:hypothetical protein Dda_5153 [Drechslerella dactyloides]|uniref:Uncharacterized protein n=1 Tax=Drechslerella dactyloides TaxID=74499 RepID=A0AAD6IZS1_DREDA|nr:hypothetical protein Dda_5153 [Drechslerella dactyloides]